MRFRFVWTCGWKVRFQLIFFVCLTGTQNDPLLLDASIRKSMPWKMIGINSSLPRAIPGAIKHILSWLILKYVGSLMLSQGGYRGYLYCKPTHCDSECLPTHQSVIGGSKASFSGLPAWSPRSSLRRYRSGLWTPLKVATGRSSVLPIGLDSTLVAIYVGFFYANLKRHFKAGKPWESIRIGWYPTFKETINPWDQQQVFVSLKIGRCTSREQHEKTSSSVGSPTAQSG